MIFISLNQSSRQQQQRSHVCLLLLVFTAVFWTNFAYGVKIPNAKDFSGIEAEVEAAANGPNENEDYDRFVHDLAVKLKPEFADDLVSDLFATSYGLQKVARVRNYNFIQDI